MELKWKEVKLNWFDDFKENLGNELTNYDNYVGTFTINYKDSAVYLTITEFFLFNKYSNWDIIENYMEANLIYQESLILENFKNKYNREEVRITLYYTKFEII